MAASSRGLAVRVSAGRKLIFELMRQSRKVPLVTVRREIAIPGLIEARKQAYPRVSWIALFAKAYSLVAQRHVHLRRNWLSFPWGRIYEHPCSHCVVLVEREWDGEEVVLGGKIRSPESQTLAEIDAHLRRFRNEPIRSISEFRQVLHLARFPAILRRFIYWSSLNWNGFKRCKRFGTFAISSLGNLGCELIAPQTPLTGYLTFGPITEEGRVAVCLTFDHRVMDGRHAAQALEALEQVLNTVVVRELRRSATTPKDAGEVAARCDPSGVGDYFHPAQPPDALAKPRDPGLIAATPSA